MAYIFQIVDINNIDIVEYYNFPSKRIFTTLPWIKFIEDHKHAKPLILKILKDGQYIGYFTGLTIRKLGIKILGSPLRGWSTCYMGFDLVSEFNRVEIIKELEKFSYNKLGIHYIEISDINIKMTDLDKYSISYEVMETLIKNIEQPEEIIFKNIESDARNYIRQFNKRGATIREYEPNKEFAQMYYQQLKEVFSRQGLIPTYNLEKVTSLLHYLSNSNMVLCLGVKSPDGELIATGIFPGYNKEFYFWGGASQRKTLNYRPNEGIQWEAIRYWKTQDCTTYDMMGDRNYKRKFAPEYVQYPIILLSKYKYLIIIRNITKKMVYLKSKVYGRFKK